MNPVESRNEVWRGGILCFTQVVIRSKYVGGFTWDLEAWAWGLT